MVWLPLYHNYFIAKAKHFPFPVLTILPSDSIYFHKPSAILIWQSPFKLDRSQLHKHLAFESQRTRDFEESAVYSRLHSNPVWSGPQE